MTKTVDFTNGTAGSAGGGGTTTIDTSSIVTAIQDTTENDETQGILADILVEAGDTQALLVALDTAIQGASDEAVVTGLTSVQTAIQDTTESDETQVKLDSVISSVVAEGDETQTALASLLNELQIINAPIGTLVSESSVRDAHSTIPAGNELVIVHNTGSVDLNINGVTLAPGSYFTREVNKNKLPSYSITAFDNYEVSVEHLAGQGGISITPPTPS